MNAELLSAVTDEARSVEARCAAIDGALAAGVDVREVDEDGYGLLHFAVIEAPHLAVVQKLLDAGVELNRETHDGRRALDLCLPASRRLPAEHLAACVATARGLVELGATLGSACSVFHYVGAAPAILEVVFDLFDLDVRDAHGNTPLHRFATAGPPTPVEMLVRRGVPLDVVNDMGLTPLLATMRVALTPFPGPVKNVATIRAAGGPERVDVPETEDFTPFDTAAMAKAVRGADVSDRVQMLLVRRFAKQPLLSYQEMAGFLFTDMDDPPDTLAVVSLCAEVLGEPRGTRVFEGDQRFTLPFFHHGDVHVRGHMETTEGFLVTGNLIVDGVLEHTEGSACLIVGGELSTEALHTRRELHVRGKLEARQVVFGRGGLRRMAAHPLVTPLFISRYQAVFGEVEGAVYDILTAEEDAECAAAQQAVAQLEQVLVPEVFRDDRDGVRTVDEEALFDRLRAGLGIRLDG